MRLSSPACESCVQGSQKFSWTVHSPLALFQPLAARGTALTHPPSSSQLEASSGLLSCGGAATPLSGLRKTPRAALFPPTRESSPSCWPGSLPPPLPGLLPPSCSLPFVSLSCGGEMPTPSPSGCSPLWSSSPPGSTCTSSSPRSVWAEDFG
jgi:hypothetical protein